MNTTPIPFGTLTDEQCRALARWLAEYLRGAVSPTKTSRKGWVESIIGQDGPIAYVRCDGARVARVSLGERPCWEAWNARHELLRVPMLAHSDRRIDGEAAMAAVDAASPLPEVPR